MEYLVLALFIAIIIVFFVLFIIYRDRVVELQLVINNLKSIYDDKYLERIKRLEEENLELKKYKSLYELNNIKKKK